MSKFALTLSKLQQAITQIGQTEFSFKPDWLKEKQSPSSYSDNALQAIWNISTVLLQAAQKAKQQSLLFHAYPYLLQNKSNLTQWFDFLEPAAALTKDRKAEAGVLRIIDETSYRLGLAFRQFLTEAIADKEAGSLLTGEGIDNFKRLIKGLNTRLQDYEAKAALDTYTVAINRLPIQPPIPVPIAIVDDGGATLSYHIPPAVSALSLTTQQFYSTFITQLQDYVKQLSDTARNLQQQHDEIKGKPFPPEAGVHTAPFITAQKQACDQRIKQKHALERQQQRATQLLIQAQHASQALDDSFLGAQHHNISDLNLNAETTRITANASLQAYRAKKRSIEAMPPVELLPSITEKAVQRRAVLAHAQDILSQAVSLLTFLYNDLPKTHMTTPIFKLMSAEELLPCLDYTDEHKKGLLKVLCQDVESISRKSRRLISATEGEKSIVKKLVDIVQTNQERIRAELAIDITKPARDFEAKHDGAEVTLYTLGCQYQKTVDFMNQTKALPVLELQSRLDAMAQCQAQLNASITELNYKLQNIQAEKLSIKMFLDQVHGQLPSQRTLHLLEHTKKNMALILRSVNEANDQGASISTLFTNIDHAYAAQDAQWQDLERLNAAITVAIPQRLQSQFGTLQQERHELGEKKSATDAPYRELLVLIEKWSETELACQKRVLQSTFDECDKTELYINSKKTWAPAAKVKSLEDLNQRLQSLTVRHDFFIQKPEKHQVEIQQIQEHKAKLLALTDQLDQIIPIKPEVVDLTAQLSKLTTQFFGSSSVSNTPPTQGIFFDYLEKRHHTFNVRDFFGQLASCLLCCFSYKSNQQLRTKFIDNLDIANDTYTEDSSNSKKYFDLTTLINQGLRDFTPRSTKGPEYQESLHAKLTKYKSDLETIHAQILAQTPKQAHDLKM